MNDSSGGQGSSEILTEDIPKYGKVSLLFYIPDNVKDRDTMVELIRQNGGNIVEFQESFTYQIGTPGHTGEEDYYPGTVYSFQWLVESVEKGELQDKAKYILCNFQSGKEFPFNKKKIQYTIREIIIIYNWISGRKSQASRKTWESLGNDGVLHCRSRESLKNFWKKWRKHSLLDCMDEMLGKDTKYCHNYAEPVLPHQPLPSAKKNKLKRTKEESETKENGEENIGGETEEEMIQNAMQKKRKLKKKESESVKAANSDAAPSSDHKMQKIEEIKQVEAIVDDDEEAEGDNIEDNKDTNAEEKMEEKPDEKANDSKEEKKEVQRAKKPDEPLDDNSVDGVVEGSQGSSDLGFPSLEAGSDDAGGN